MNRWTDVFIFIIVITICSSCGNKNMNNRHSDQATNSGKQKLIVGATPVPHAEILDYIKPELEKKGVELEVQPFTDYVQPNIQVHEKQLDANFFQHKLYMDHEVKTKGYHVINLAAIHVEPFGGYSKKIKSIDKVKDGATIALPNDATNAGRALLLLEKQGLLILKPGCGFTATVRDIVHNPKHLQFKELEAAMLARTLDEVELALVNTNYALQASLDPMKDALFMEDMDSPYVNILTVHADNKNNAALQKLVHVLQTEAVKTFIAKKYKGAIVPVF